MVCFYRRVRALSVYDDDVMLCFFGAAFTRLVSHGFTCCFHVCLLKKCFI
jgi:hypothetical protein